MMQPEHPRSTENEPTSRRHFLQVSTSNLLLATGMVGAGIAAVLNARRVSELQHKIAEVKQSNDFLAEKVRVYEAPLLLEKVRESIVNVEVIMKSGDVSRSQGMVILQPRGPKVLYIPYSPSTGGDIASYRALLQDGVHVLDPHDEVPFFAQKGRAIPIQKTEHYGDPNRQKSLSVYMPKPEDVALPGLFVSFPDFAETPHAGAVTVWRHDKGLFFGRDESRQKEGDWNHGHGVVVNLQGDIIGFTGMGKAIDSDAQRLDTMEDDRTDEER